METIKYCKVVDLVKKKKKKSRLTVIENKLVVNSWVREGRGMIWGVRSDW